MKINRRALMTVVLSLVAVCAASSVAAAQSGRSARVREVKVYFPKDGESSDMNRNPLNLQPVGRKVRAASPVRPTIEALLKGPTEAEERQGFHALDAQNMYITRLTVRGGTAHASFSRRGGPQWAGDLAPETFRQSVTRTLRQFPGVRRTIVCVDGLLNFGGAGEEVPDRKCPR
ncbi:MAG TPA: GerMN domain-containing protein [Pyrinomonadaceae bacterium]|nr:GerMN domain-containing protein [Pyrinomonadaceae bacterium]